MAMSSQVKFVFTFLVIIGSHKELTVNCDEDQRFLDHLLSLRSELCMFDLRDKRDVTYTSSTKLKGKDKKHDDVVTIPDRGSNTFVTKFKSENEERKERDDKSSRIVFPDSDEIKDNEPKTKHSVQLKTSNATRVNNSSSVPVLTSRFGGLDVLILSEALQNPVGVNTNQPLVNSDSNKQNPQIESDSVNQPTYQVIPQESQVTITPSANVLSNVNTVPQYVTNYPNQALYQFGNPAPDQMNTIQGNDVPNYLTNQNFVPNNQIFIQNDIYNPNNYIQNGQQNLPLGTPNNYNVNQNLFNSQDLSGVVDRQYMNNPENSIQQVNVAPTNIPANNVANVFNNGNLYAIVRINNDGSYNSQDVNNPSNIFVANYDVAVN